MSTKELYWRIPLDTADRFMDCIELGGPNINMADNQEQVHLPISDCFLKPCLFDSLLYWLDNGIVVVASKIEDKPERKNS